MSNTLIFRFGGDSSSELISTVLRLGNETSQLSCIRGKTPGAFQGFGSFQWTRAVQGLSELVIRSKLSSIANDVAPYISGERGSVVAALDYAISKQPAWMIDMFGQTIHGRPGALSLFRRTNTNQRRPGPVVIALNTQYLPPESISIYWNDTEVESSDGLRALLGAVTASVMQD